MSKIPKNICGQRRTWRWLLRLWRKPAKSPRSAWGMPLGVKEQAENVLGWGMRKDKPLAVLSDRVNASESDE